jgi:hypothetical protein
LKKNIREYFPVITTALISIVLIILSNYYHPAHPHPDPGKFTGRRPERREGGGIFKLLGNGAVLAGALSFSWYLFKKKLKSPFQVIKTAAKKAHSVHTYVGWIALALVAVHGGYYLITDFKNENILTGAAAFLLLLCLAGYGYILKRKKKKTVRSAHFILSIMWIAAILIHGGGFVVACGIGMAVLFVGVTWLERRTKRTSKLKSA